MSGFSKQFNLNQLVSLIHSNRNYHTVGTIPRSNIKILQRDTIDTPDILFKNEFITTNVLIYFTINIISPGKCELYLHNPCCQL